MSLLADTVARVMPADAAFLDRARRRLDNLTKPPGSLGRLEDLAARLVAVTRRDPPRLRDRRLFIFSADHGVAAEGVSAYPAEVTPQMTLNFLAGGAAVNALAKLAGLKVTVVDIGVNYEFQPTPAPAGSSGSDGTGTGPTGATPRLVVRKIAPGTANMARGPAMSLEEARRAVEVGIELALEAAAAGADLLAVGEMGIGNTTAATALAAALTGIEPAVLTGRGTGIDERRLAHKIEVVRRALAVNRPSPDDPIDCLAKVGGFELGGMAGVILAGSAERRPVVVDGFIATAAALLAVRLAPLSADCLFLSHKSAERGAAAVIEALGAGEPLLDLGMRLGEGTGACLAVCLIDGALRCYSEMATFEEARVARASEETH